MHGHIKLRHGRPDGSQFGTLDPKLDFKPSPFKPRSQSVVAGASQTNTYGGDHDNNNSMMDETNRQTERSNRKFLRETPSIKDMDIRKLIGKYPVAMTKDAKEYTESAKNGTLDIIK